MGAVVSGHRSLGEGWRLEAAMKMGDAVLTEGGRAEGTSKPRPVLLDRREQWLCVRKTPGRREESPRRRMWSTLTCQERL